MKFRFCLIILGLVATVHTSSGSPIDPNDDRDADEEPKFFSSVHYFSNVLNNIQGALEDIFIGGENLKIMEEKLQNMVNESGAFFKAESVAEYAVDAKPYNNAWKHDNKKVE